MIEKGKKAEFEQYQCNKCGRFFYIDKNDKSDLDLEGYICPFNCSHYLVYDSEQTGNHTRTVTITIENIEG